MQAFLANIHRIYWILIIYTIATLSATVTVETYHQTSTVDTKQLIHNDHFYMFCNDNSDRTMTLRVSADSKIHCTLIWTQAFSSVDVHHLYRNLPLVIYQSKGILN